MATTRKLILDTDTGLDDAQAILMALSVIDVEIVGITCVAGNADVIQVGRNVLRVLQVAERLQIPVYIGCNDPLLGNKKPQSDYHGSDGLGDAPDPGAPDDSHLKQEHAVEALIRMSKEYAGDVSLVAIGPLTNIAMAIRLDPGFGQRLKHCYMMGGSYLGKGNVTASAEFNFYCDPEAACITLNQLKAPITLIPWEVCIEHTLPWDWYVDFHKLNTKKTRFLAEIEKNVIDRFYRPALDKGLRKGYEIVDQYAVAVAMYDDVMVDSVKVFATVTEGQMVIDWMNVLGKEKNITIVTKLNTERVKYYMRLIR